VVEAVSSALTQTSEVRLGGVLIIAVKRHLHCYRILLQNNDVEKLFVKLSIGSFILLIGADNVLPNFNINRYL